MEHVEVEILKNEKEAIASDTPTNSDLPSQHLISKNVIQEEGILMSDSECNENEVRLQTSTELLSSQLPLRISFTSCLSFLIVDDSLVNRKMTEKLLSRFGHCIQSAGDGLEFLSKINCDKDNAELRTFGVVQYAETL
jgi:hypothetical protein